MESQFQLFERPETKGIGQVPTDIPSFNECERLETSYKENLHHCKRVKSQARLPTEILTTLQSQVGFYFIYLFILYIILIISNFFLNTQYVIIIITYNKLTKRYIINLFG